MSRAKRRTKEERASILRTVKRGPDGKPKRGAVARVASRVGVSEGTIYGWISRDGWPDDDATEAARKQEAKRLASGLASGLASAEEISQNRDELAEASLASMGSLTPEQATAVQLRLEGASINSIAQELGRGWNTVDRWFSQPGPVADALGRQQALHAVDTAIALTSAAASGSRVAAQGLVAVEVAIVACRKLQANAMERLEHAEVVEWGAKAAALMKMANATHKTALEATGVMGGGLPGGEDTDRIDQYLDSLTDEQLAQLAEGYFDAEAA